MTQNCISDLKPEARNKVLEAKANAIQANMGTYDIPYFSLLLQDGTHTVTTTFLVPFSYSPEPSLGKKRSVRTLAGHPRDCSHVRFSVPPSYSQVEPVYVQNRVSVNEISSLKEGKLEWRKMVKCKYVRSGCTTALNVVPWETDGESVLREACLTRASFHDLLLFSYLSFIVSVFCFYPIRKVKPPNAQVVQDVEAWKHSDFLCHNYVLNGLVGSLYNVYCKTTTAKELWESLERKHKTKDAGTKKFYRNLVEFL
ncbi:hypothetical protein Tco_1002822 [Tanacetum coccineum]|uniref:Uncharacterized protein n=1 Tax=Tanacetum coccineum TaxID=301880 RepID=A0ABQ5F896_9ASTR